MRNLTEQPDPRPTRGLSDDDRWTCPGCRRVIETRYCPTCGETLIDARDLTLHAILRQAVEALSSVDGRLLRSFRSLVTQPGLLTTAYLEGRRRPYILPLQLFLVANVIFFAMQSLTGVKVFSTPLASHLHDQVWSGLARDLVAQRLAATHRTIEQYAPVFDQAVALNAKSLIGVMVLPFAILPSWLFRRARLPAVAHVVFSLHFYAFLLLLFSVALAVGGLDVVLGGPGLRSEATDHALSLAELAICAVYLFVATGRAYGGTWGVRILQAAALTLSVAAIFLGYRFLLLPITLYAT